MLFTPTCIKSTTTEYVIMAKGKGSKFERSMCKLLSIWWAGRDDIFWRTSQSGGRATERKKKGLATAGSYGDMTAIDELGRPFDDFFVMEFKKGYTNDLDLLSLVDSLQIHKVKEVKIKKLEKGVKKKKKRKRKKGPTLINWWLKNEHIKRQARRKYGLVIFERNYHSTCIIMQLDLFILIQGYAGELSGVNIIDVYIERINDRIIIIPLASFLEWCTGATMKMIIEEE